MRTWFMRIIEVLNEDVPMYMVEGMEVECDGYVDHVSDFDSWGTFYSTAEAEACLKSVLTNYHKARPWSDYAQELYDGSLVP